MSCQIILDNPGAYHPGDTVYGRVLCKFSSSENFRGIRCKFRGREHTAWTKRESYYDSSSKSTKYRTVHYSGDNKFLAINVNLLGEGTLSRGEYEYPFSFTFPKYKLPNPYNGNYGYIRYYVKGYVDRPFAFDYEDEITLHLISPINFNDIRCDLQLQPIAYQDEKVMCCCCCASDPITMDVILEKEAFVVGEMAKIKVEITNMSNESIQQLLLSLKMTIESKATSPSTSHKYDEELLAVKSYSGVGAHGQRTYKIDFPIPSTAVIPNFGGCSLFKQWCVLTVEACVPGCHTNLEIETGITLGHIPIVEGPTFGSLVPAFEAPGGAFPASLPPVPPNFSPPPYALGDDAPPYPTGPPLFPLPNGNDIGFGGGISGKGMPMPVPIHGGQSSASAPQAEETPSAPPKAKMAEEEGFDLMNDDDNNEPPPPSYQDVQSGPLSNTTRPTAPPE